MAKLTPKQQERIDSLIVPIKNYLDLRFEHASRVNSKLQNIYEDMVHQHLMVVRDVLSGDRMFGPKRFSVCDIFCSTDQTKKLSLMNPMDQASIMSLMVAERAKADTDKKRAGMLDVHDLPTLYAALDPSTKSVMELIQMWVWWDLIDATHIRNFDVNSKRLQALIDAGGATAAGIAVYLQAPPEELRMEDLEEYDETQETPDQRAGRLFITLVRIRNRFERERRDDESYKVILKRDETSAESSEVNGLILEGGRRVMAMDKVRQSETIAESLKAYYAKAFHCPPEQVTKERIIEHETQRLSDLTPRLKTALDRNATLGPPYDFKLRQFEEMERAIQAVREPLQIAPGYILPTISSEIHREQLEMGVAPSVEDEPLPLQEPLGGFQDGPLSF